MKKTLFGIAAVAAIVGMVVIGANLEAAGPQPISRTEKAAESADFSVLTMGKGLAATVTPMNFATGFEGNQGYTARDGTCVQTPCPPGGPHVAPGFTGECGFIVGQGNTAYPEPWGTSTSSALAIEPHIDTANPFAGAQHMRFDKDICDGTALPGGYIQQAFFPPGAAKPQPIAPATITFQYANPGLFGSDMNFQPQAGSQGLWTTRIMVFYYGFFYVLEDQGAGLAWQPVFYYWDTTPGAYHEFAIIHDPCAKFKCLGGPNYLRQCADGTACVDDDDCDPGTCLSIQNECPNGTIDCRACVGGTNEGTPCVGDFQCDGGSCDGGDCLGEVDWTYDGNLIYAGTMMNGTTTEQFLAYNNNFPGAQDIDDFSWVGGDPCPTICGNDEIEAGEECDGPNDGNCPGRCIPAGETGPGGEAECTCIIEGETCDSAADLPNGNTAVITAGGWWTFTADTPAYAIDMCDTLTYDSYLYVFTGTCDSLEFLAFNDDCNIDDPTYGPGADPLAPCHPVGSPYQACTCIPTVAGQQYWVFTRALLGAETAVSLTKRETCGAIWEGGACCDGYGDCVDDVLEADCSDKGDIWYAQKYCPQACDTILGACCDHGPDLGGLCIDGMQADQCAGEKQEFLLDTLCVDVQCDEVLGACCDGTHGSCSQTLRGDCLDGRPNMVWTQATSCSAVDCDPLPGACVDQFNPDPLARNCLCEDNVILAACQGDKQYWVKGSSCAAELPECLANFQAIPTVSEWGLVVLALLLLVGAKVYFGRREVVA